jgi:hypothetical protein
MGGSGDLEAAGLRLIAGPLPAVPGDVAVLGREVAVEPRPGDMRWLVCRLPGCDWLLDIGRPAFRAPVSREAAVLWRRVAGTWLLGLGEWARGPSGSPPLRRSETIRRQSRRAFTMLLVPGGCCIRQYGQCTATAVHRRLSGSPGDVGANGTSARATAHRPPDNIVLTPMAPRLRTGGMTMPTRVFVVLSRSMPTPVQWSRRRSWNLCGCCGTKA